MWTSYSIDDQIPAEVFETTQSYFVIFDFSTIPERQTHPNIFLQCQLKYLFLPFLQVTMGTLYLSFIHNQITISHAMLVFDTSRSCQTLPDTAHSFHKNYVVDFRI